MRNKLTLLILSTLLCGCASTIQTRQIAPNLKHEDTPRIGTTAKAEVGETILKKSKVYTFDGIDLQNEVSGGDGNLYKKFTLPPGKYTALLESTPYKVYLAEHIRAHDNLLGDSFGQAGLAINQANPDDTTVYAFGSLLKPSLQPIFSKTTIVVKERPSFVQELLYSGRSGETAKFLYREFRDDLARPAFNQELQYDLQADKTIGFRGVRVQILKATNTSIEYRIQNSFSDEP